MKKILSYIPTKAYSTVNHWLEKYNCEVTISYPRKSKLGDYRSPYNNNKHSISVNKDLNKYAFLITLTHEIAHMMIWEKYKNNVKPHGKEWKEMFKKLIFGILPFFPIEIQKCLAIHLKNPKGSTTSDYRLSKILLKYNKKPTLTISDIPCGSIFSTSNGKKYIKEKKLRKRYCCKCLENNKIYLFNPIAEVQI